MLECKYTGDKVLGLLNLSENHISEIGGQRIARALKNQMRIAHLNLKHNNIGNGA
jgi:hypothetical protein